jgi:predicted RNA-binding Zn ribbon-like protein
MSTVSASERYSTSVAPASLRLAQELANTISHPRPPAGDDLLGELASARAWLGAQLGDWQARHGVTIPGFELRPGSLRQLRQLRGVVRALLSEDSTAGPPAITAPLEATITADGSLLSPAGRGITWLRGAVAIELHQADLRDELRRLKICRNAQCGVAFYDRSKNNSRTWHDVGKCGNMANVRAYRERQRARSPAD